MSDTQFTAQISDETRSNPTNKNSDVDPRGVNPYLFVSDFYDGVGGVYDGSYLMSYIRESFLESRRQQATYRNFLKPIVRATIDPVFSARIIRESNSEMFDEFLDNVDNRDNRMTQFSSNVATLSRLHGVCFTVMDNFTLVPELERDAIEQRKFPYIYNQPAYTVDSHKVDEFNRLVSISFFRYEEIDKKQYKIVTTWDSNYKIVEYFHDTNLIKTEAHEHNLGVLPIVVTYLDSTSLTLPPPPVYDMAKLCYTIFNKDSEIRDAERAQAFNIFYLQTDTENNNLTIGPRNAIVIPPGNDITITPGFASPDPAILEGLVNNNEKLIESLYSIAAQNGINAVKQTSGVAESYKFFASNQQLKKTATLATNFELKVADLFSLYVSKEIEYKSVFPSTWDPFYAKLSIDELIKLVELDLSPEITVEIKKLIASNVLEHLDSDRIEKLNETIGVTNDSTI